MKADILTDRKQDGFTGCFYKTKEKTDRCMIVVIGDECRDRMNTACAAWLLETGYCCALTVAVHQQKELDTGVHSWPLEYIEKAVFWLKNRGFEKIGIFGVSMQAALALTAASLIPDISMVVALTPCDFVPWGFCQGKIGREKGEWPSGTSAFSWRGEDLPFQPAGLDKNAYWSLFCQERQRYHEMHAISVFENSAQAHPLREECMIRAENIRGRLILVGAEDDSMWNTAKYIRRLEKRLKEKNFSYPVEIYLYPAGTHLLAPEGMVQKALPLLGDLIYRAFAAGRDNAWGCRRSREDLEKKLSASLAKW